MEGKEPFSTNQISQVRYFNNADDVQAWVDMLTKPSSLSESEEPYYMHIDHFVVLPFASKKPGILALTIYHRVYLQIGK